VAAVTQRLALLGSTGSIGGSALEVVRHHPDRLAIETLATFGRKLDELERQTLEFRPSLVAVYDEARAAEFAGRAPDGVKVVSGEAGVLEAATASGVDRVLAAMVGAVGLKPVHAALSAGKDVALANKESMVVAGPMLTALARSKGVEIVPVDSEHAALHQTLRASDHAEVRRLVLTASGGPFRQRDISTWGEIKPQEALKHPTWDMGAKISVDSATLMNKGLELIEARHLFDVSPERIEVVIHPQSIVHSMVEFCDGCWLAQLSVNDMIFPIQYALSYPERWDNEFPRLEPWELGRLEFEEVDPVKFPTIDLVRAALAMGDSGPAVLNAANEVAVEAFLAERIAFSSIVPTVESVLEAHQPVAVETLEEALAWDRWGRERAEETLQ
jgi:1-deoxy-D-xylulose-5-phosphate reductoisomerase